MISAFEKLKTAHVWVIYLSKITCSQIYESYVYVNNCRIKTQPRYCTYNNELVNWYTHTFSCHLSRQTMKNAHAIPCCTRNTQSERNTEAISEAHVLWAPEEIEQSAANTEEPTPLLLYSIAVFLQQRKPAMNGLSTTRCYCNIQKLWRLHFSISATQPSYLFNFIWFLLK